MAHDAKIATVEYWVTEDGKSFATKDAAGTYEMAVDTKQMTAALGGKLSQHGKQLSESINKLDIGIQQAKDNIKKYQSIIIKAQRIVQKLEDKSDDEISEDEYENLQNANSDVEEYTTAIMDETKNVSDQKSKKESIIGFEPMIAAFSSYRSSNKYPNDWACFKDFVLNNTASFLDWASKAGAFCDLEVEIARGGYWDITLEDGSVSPLHEAGKKLMIK